MDENLKALTDEKNSRLTAVSAAVSGYGLAAIRGVFVLNGSAAVAVLSKQQTLTPDGACVVLWCAIGAAMAVLCAGACFVAQWFSQANHLESYNLGICCYQKFGRSDAVSFAMEFKWHEIISFIIAAALYLASMVCYALAAYSLIKLL